jgi:hypothetical protein
MNNRISVLHWRWIAAVIPIVGAVGSAGTIGCTPPAPLGCEPQLGGGGCETRRIGGIGAPPSSMSPPPTPPPVPANAGDSGALNSTAGEDRCLSTGFSVPLVVAAGSPYASLVVQVPNAAPVQGLFLLDTGTNSTKVSRTFATSAGLAGACSVHAGLGLAAVPLPSDFLINKDSSAGGDTNCPGADVDYPTISVDASSSGAASTRLRQDGIVGADWLGDWFEGVAVWLDFANRRGTFWSKGSWAACASRFDDHAAMKVIDGPTTTKATTSLPKPSCSFGASTLTGCSVPYVSAVVKMGGVELLRFPAQIDTGRDRSLPELLSVNKSLLGKLEALGLTRSSKCTGGGRDPCNVRVYALKTGVRLEIAPVSMDLPAVEYRDGTNGPPYSEPEAIGLVGMSVLNFRSIVIDPFDARLLVR